MRICVYVHSLGATAHEDLICKVWRFSFARSKFCLEIMLKQCQYRNRKALIDGSVSRVGKVRQTVLGLRGSKGVG